MNTFFDESKMILLMMILFDITKNFENRYSLHCSALSNFNNKGLKSKLFTCNGQGICSKDGTCQCNFCSKKLFYIKASRFCKSTEQKSIHLKQKCSHHNSSLYNLKFCKVSIQYAVVISKWKIECCSLLLQLFQEWSQLSERHLLLLSSISMLTPKQSTI